MNKQMIGIASVFALTFFLLVLRHCFLALGRPNRSRYVNPTAPRGNLEMNTKAVEDDSWLLCSTDDDAGSPNRVDNATRAAPAPRDRGRTLLRFIAGR